mgnify:CR=1 FL=1
MKKISKMDWELATTCVGSAMALAPAGTPEADRRLGLGLAGFSQRLPDEVWNRAAETSEGMLLATTEKEPEADRPIRYDVNERIVEGSPDSVRRVQFLLAAIGELSKAYSKHGAEAWSRHEFAAVLREEFEELWDAIKTDRPIEEILREAAQIVCVCVRYAETPDRYKGPHPEISR